RTLAFNVPGGVVAVGRLDSMVELWAWREGARLAAFPAHHGFVAAALFLHAGCQLLTAGEDGKMVIGWLLDIERMALGSTKSLQVPRGLRVRHWMWQCPPWPG
ncbi:telomerase associated protein 1, partial [Homo sapiens]